MRVAAESLDQCEALFGCFVEQYEIERIYRYDLFSAVFDDRDLTSETLRVLCSFAADRCLAVYCLLRNGLVWDAEIVLRSFYEAVAKCLFISTAPTRRKEDLLSEFWNTLPAIYDAKSAQKAAVVESLARRFGKAEDVRIFAGLRNPKHFAIDPIANKKFRNEVEQRWSFSRIVTALTKGEYGHARIAHADALFHNYGVASHFAHASPIAFDFLEDRSTRGDDLGPLERGHIARMLCDMVMLTAYMLSQAQSAMLGELPMAKVLISAIERMSNAAAPFGFDFQRSQDDFYAGESRSDSSNAETT